MTALETVAFDIETTGFSVEDRLTVVGFDADIGSRVFLNTSGRSPPELDAQSIDGLDRSVSLSVQQSETRLLDSMHSFVESSLADRDLKLVAYNGERWNGGFDLPFLRTRLSLNGVDWPFRDLPYIDVMDVFETRFNTSEDTLSGVYGELIGAGLNELDPFADSGEAVTTWEEGNYEPLIIHNVADIQRTRALMNLAERYCSKSDFSMKSLEPII